MDWRGRSGSNRTKRLKEELRSELQGARIERGSDRAGAATECSIQPVPLGVVEGVECLKTKLEGGLLPEGEVFEQGDVPVLASRSANDALALAAEGPQGGSGERRRIE